MSKSNYLPATTIPSIIIVGELVEYSNSHIDGIKWDGRDMNNNLLPQGIYIYKLHVKNLYDNSSITTFNKMIKRN